MQFRILGPCSITNEANRRQARLTSPKQRLLLGALLFNPGEPVPADQLIQELWGDEPPDRAGNALQAHISRLRQVLAAVEPAGRGRRLTTGGGSYVLQARPNEVDSAQFRLEAARARRTSQREPQAAHRLLYKALGRWRGPALGGAVGDLPRGQFAAQLEEERLQAVEDLHDLALRLGHERQILGRLGELALEYPDRERFRTLLALAQERTARGVKAPSAVAVAQPGAATETAAPEARRTGDPSRLAHRPTVLATGIDDARDHDMHLLRVRVGQLESDLARLSEALGLLRVHLGQLADAAAGASPPFVNEDGYQTGWPRD